MIHIKTAEEIQKMRLAGQLLARTHEMIIPYIKDGISTFELDAIIEDFILTNNAIPSFKGYGGFPASACISTNDIVVHGIPSKDIILKDGDIVGIDIGVIVDGWHSDAARTHAVGKITGRDTKLIENTKECFFKGIATIKDGTYLGDISATIQSYAEQQGYGVVRDLSGHGIGKKLHEAPQVPNFGQTGTGIKLKKGMTLAIEPMINQGTYKVYQDSDQWTIRTQDGQNSAHYENTIVVTDTGVEILSILN